VIAIAAIRLAVRLRSGKFGSRLLIKLAGIFAFVGVVPGVLIYTVSVQFVSRSIETWFDAQVAGALDAGLALGRGTLDALSVDLVSKTRLAAERLAGSRQPIGPLTLGVCANRSTCAKSCCSARAARCWPAPARTRCDHAATPAAAGASGPRRQRSHGSSGLTTPVPGTTRPLRACAHWR
jgi:nitrogen fixation/metabolism regulation signal transduction histidine kinase